MWSPGQEEYIKASLRTFFQWLELHNLSQPQGRDILAYQEYLKDVEKKKAKTVTAYTDVINRFFRWTGQEGLYPDVVADMPALKAKSKTLTVQQTKRILDKMDCGSIQGLRNYAIVALMITAGLNSQEVSNTKIGDFCPLRTAAVLHIPSRKSNNEIQLDSYVEFAMRRYLKARESKETVLTEKAPLFSSVERSNREAALSKEDVGQILGSALQSAGYDSGQVSICSLKPAENLLTLADVMERVEINLPMWTYTLEGDKQEVTI